MKLAQISLSGFKSIKECSGLLLGDRNVFVGANGSGKSNFLSIFRMLNAAMAGGFQEFVGREGGAHSLLHFGPKFTQRIGARLVFTNPRDVGDLGDKSYEVNFSFAAPDTLMITHEAVKSQRTGQLDNGEWRKLGGGNKESILRLATAHDSTSALLKDALEDIRRYQFHDTSESSRFRGRVEIEDARTLYGNGANLAAVLRRLREVSPERYEQVRTTVQAVAPFFQDFILEPDFEGGDSILLRWKSKGPGDYEFGPHQLSDGTLRFIALATLLIQPAAWRPSLLTIDEPELGLHPFALETLAGLLEAASGETQLFVSTQSPTLMDMFRPEDIVVVRLDAESTSTKLERLQPEALKDWLNDYTVGELVRKNVIEAGPTYA